MVLTTASCGDDATGPGLWNSRLRIVDRGGSSDTVLAMSASPLVVLVRDEHGHPVQGALVKFFVRQTSPGDSNSAKRSVYVCSVRSPECAWYYDDSNYSVTVGVVDTTDAAGHVRANVQFGVSAGQASIEVSVPELESSVSISYTTRPGALARVVPTVPDTAVYVGASYELTAHPADRFGNALEESVVLSGATPGVITVTSGRVTAVGVGRGRVLMRAGNITDTACVSVPPHGRIVAARWAPDGSLLRQLMLVDTDGSARRAIASTPGDLGYARPVWTPDGGSLLFQEDDAASEAQLQLIDTLGHRRVLLANPADFSRSLQPAFSATGAALYFLGTRISTGEVGVYRANADGSGSQFLFSGVQPAPSPDGTRIAYVSGTSLMVREMATGQTSLVAANPELPVWSPAGDLIAFSSYRSPDDVRVVRPDGSGLRTLASRVHGSSVSWSPDGAWLVTTNDAGVLELIRVADGERLPIPGTQGLDEPAWRPEVYRSALSRW